MNETVEQRMFFIGLVFEGEANGSVSAKQGAEWTKLRYDTFPTPFPDGGLFFSRKRAQKSAKGLGPQITGQMHADRANCFEQEIAEATEKRFYHGPAATGASTAGGADGDGWGFFLTTKNAESTERQRLDQK